MNFNKLFLTTVLLKATLACASEIALFDQLYELEDKNTFSLEYIDIDKEQCDEFEERFSTTRKVIERACNDSRMQVLCEDNKNSLRMYLELGRKIGFKIDTKVLDQSVNNLGVKTELNLNYLKDIHISKIQDDSNVKFYGDLFGIDYFKFDLLNWRQWDKLIACDFLNQKIKISGQGMIKAQKNMNLSLEQKKYIFDLTNYLNRLDLSSFGNLYERLIGIGKHISLFPQERVAGIPDILLFELIFDLRNWEIRKYSEIREIQTKQTASASALINVELK